MNFIINIHNFQISNIEIPSRIALPNSFLNRPPWIDWVFFYSDEAESFYNDVATDLINDI